MGGTLQGDISTAIASRNLLVPLASTPDPLTTVHTSPTVQDNGAAAIADNQQLAAQAPTVSVSAFVGQPVGSAGTTAAKTSQWAGLPMRISAKGAAPAFGGSYSDPHSVPVAVGVNGATISVNPDGSPANTVGAVSAWQMGNPGLDTFARVGLPVIAGYAGWKGHTFLAIVAAAPAALLWYNRLRGGL